MKTQYQNEHSFITLNGDLFEHIIKRVKSDHNGSTVIVPHVCNNIDSFGSGFAAQVAKYYPVVKANYHLLGKNFLKNNPGHAQIIEVYEEPKYRHKLYFVNMIAQNGIKAHNNPRPLNYLHLVSSMVKVSQFIKNKTGFHNKTEKVEIHAPKFGSMLAGGDWNLISYLIDDIWSDYNVYIYNYNNKKGI